MVRGAHQITTVDRSKLTGKKVGAISEAKQRALDAAIRNYLSL
jgi:mRNA-degrading endonuclease toxin of MazEF toxin-antitoxin module